MGLYNFQERFVPFIQDGSKCHTIRSIRKNFTKVGDTMHLYHGLRQLKPAMKLLDPSPVCTAKRTIVIFPANRIVLMTDILNTQDAISLVEAGFLFEYGRTLEDKECKELFYNDGFRAGEVFSITTAFFSCLESMHPLPFIGHLDVWHPNPSQLTYLK